MTKKSGCPSGAILRNGRCIRPVFDKREVYYVASFVGREIELETFGLDTFNQAKKKAIEFMKKDGRRRDIIIHDGVLRWEEVKRLK